MPKGRRPVLLSARDPGGYRPGVHTRAAVLEEADAVFDGMRHRALHGAGADDLCLTPVKPVALPQAGELCLQRPLSSGTALSLVFLGQEFPKSILRRAISFDSFLLDQ